MRNAAGHTPSERTVNDRLESVFRTSKGRIILTCFTSSIPRLQLVLDQARQHGRVVSFLGRRMSENTEIAEELGFLNVPPGLIIRSKDIRNHSRERVCVVAGGCQGEPMSALARVALDDHKDLKIEAGDTVILSARMIPGKERAICRMMDHFYRRRAEIYYPDGTQPPVHVSGHASEEELKLVITLVKPKLLHSDSRNVPAASSSRANWPKRPGVHGKDHRRRDRRHHSIRTGRRGDRRERRPSDAC